MSAPAAASAQAMRGNAPANAAAAAPLAGRLLLVTDAVEDAVVVIRDEQRTVLHHKHVDRPAPHRWVTLLVDEETREEWFGLDHLALGVQRDAINIVALLDGAVPGAVPCDENVVLVFVRH